MSPPVNPQGRLLTSRIMTNLTAVPVVAAFVSVAVFSARREPAHALPIASQPPTCTSHPAPTENIAGQLAKFRPVQTPFSTGGLSTREDQMVRKLVEAGQDLESIFWRQSDPEGLTIYQALANCPGAAEKDIRHYLDRKSTRLNSSHRALSRMPSSA